MPDWNVEMSLTTGAHQAVTKSVTIENAQRGIALTMGIEECLKWAEEDGSEIPISALEYWKECRGNGNVMIYEVLSNLEARWQLSFNIQEQSLVVPAKAAPTRPVTQSPGPNGAASPPNLDFRQMLAEQLTFLQARQKELLSERKRLDAEYEQNADSLADIRNFLMVSAKRPRKKHIDERPQPS